MVALPVVLQFRLAFPLWLLSLQGVASCLQCDPHFLKSLTILLTEMLPEDLPNRDTLMARHIQALANLHGTFLRRKYERVLDVRGVMAVKSDIISQLRTIKKNTWKGVFLWQLSMYQLRMSLRKKMQQTLEKFADLACSEDCTVIEGPVLDCWTCLRIATQCFDGELCGGDEDPGRFISCSPHLPCAWPELWVATWSRAGDRHQEFLCVATPCNVKKNCSGKKMCAEMEDRRLAEYNEVVLYVFLVCESVITTSIILVYVVCFKYRKRMLRKSLGY